VPIYVDKRFISERDIKACCGHDNALGPEIGGGFTCKVFKIKDTR